MKKFFKILLFVFLGFIVIGTFVWIYQKSQPKEIRYELAKVEEGDIETISVATGQVSPRDEVLVKPQISGIILQVLKKAGDHVNIGDVIATVKVVPEMSSLTSAESRIRIAEINLKQTEAEHNRQKQLFDKGVISREDMDKADADYKKTKEELSIAKESLEIIKTGISKSTAQYSNTQIRSTISGMILDVPIKVGNSVIQANTFNDGTEVGRIHVGMPMTLSVGAIEKQKFDAVLEYIAPKGVEENGAILFEIKAAAHIPDSVVIRAGYSANAEIVLSKVKNVLTIPESAVTFSNDSSFVYVFKDSTNHKQSFEKKMIKIGLSNGISTEIKSGLAKGEIVRGNEISNKPLETKKSE